MNRIHRCCLVFAITAPFWCGESRAQEGLPPPGDRAPAGDLPASGSQAYSPLSSYRNQAQTQFNTFPWTFVFLGGPFGSHALNGPVGFHHYYIEGSVWAEPLIYDGYDQHYVYYHELYWPDFRWAFRRYPSCIHHCHRPHCGSGCWQPCQCTPYYKVFRRFPYDTHWRFFQYTYRTRLSHPWSFGDPASRQANAGGVSRSGTPLMRSAARPN